MTPDDPRPPEEPVAPDALDTLASAIVDGEAPLPDDADAVLLERVAAFRAIRNAIAAPVPPPSDALREAAISSALAASATSTDVHSLATRRRRVPALPVAAVAAALALFVGVAILSLGDDARDADLAGAPSATRAVETTSAVASQATEAPATEMSGATTTAAPTPTIVPSTTIAAMAPADAGEEFRATEALDAGESTALATEALDQGLEAERGFVEAGSAPSTGSVSSDAVQEADGGFSYAEAEPPVTTIPEGAATSGMADSSDDRPVAGDEDIFALLFPYASESADAIRSGRADAWSVPVPEDAPCPDSVDAALDGEERLDVVLLRDSRGDQLHEAVLIVGPDTWAIVLTDTCAMRRYPDPNRE
ncbi:MAG: hypothetical protein CL459_01270 [Acidimicrobiaceae bacterium]|nr:hypothetical protein [Acidimicrobiaceae bacterium]